MRRILIAVLVIVGSLLGAAPASAAVTVTASELFTGTVDGGGSLWRGSLPTQITCDRSSYSCYTLEFRINGLAPASVMSGLWTRVTVDFELRNLDGTAAGSDRVYSFDWDSSVSASVSMYLSNLSSGNYLMRVTTTQTYLTGAGSYTTADRVGRFEYPVRVTIGTVPATINDLRQTIGTGVSLVHTANAVSAEPAVLRYELGVASFVSGDPSLFSSYGEYTVIAEASSPSITVTPAQYLARGGTAGIMLRMRAVNAIGPGAWGYGWYWTATDMGSRLAALPADRLLTCGWSGATLRLDTTVDGRSPGRGNATTYTWQWRAGTAEYDPGRESDWRTFASTTSASTQVTVPTLLGILPPSADAFRLGVRASNGAGNSPLGMSTCVVTRASLLALAGQAKPPTGTPGLQLQPEESAIIITTSGVDAAATAVELALASSSSNWTEALARIPVGGEYTVTLGALRERQTDANAPLYVLARFANDFGTAPAFAAMQVDGGALAAILSFRESQEITSSFAKRYVLATGKRLELPIPEATSGLDVTVRVLTPAVCAYVNGWLVAKGSGACRLRLTQAGDADYMAAAAVDVAFSVTPPAKAAVAAPKPTAKPAPSAKPRPQPTASSGADGTVTVSGKVTLRKSVTCVKGSTRKVVRGTNPTCPSGYRRVS